MAMPVSSKFRARLEAESAVFAAILLCTASPDLSKPHASFSGAHNSMFLQDREDDVNTNVDGSTILSAPLRASCFRRRPSAEEAALHAP
ncbi:MAG: hypothetical protein JWN48_5601 [Myxococcaceae bacterium]|nr:hypothetical protein [Myxococcaceae bacterium]